MNRRTILAGMMLFTHGEADAAESPRVDVTTLTGKVMCGYQGWFNCDGDGAERGFHHWTKRPDALSPSNVKIDLWPDVSELAADERFTTEFRHADGRRAEVFSSFRRPTVLRHFKWMRDYGIDGAFVQRFAVDLRDPKFRHHTDTVLGHCRSGSEEYGRAFAVMYDLTGLGSQRMDEVIADWRRLRSELRITESAAHLRHRGAPLVAVWGVGFNDSRKYTLAECRRLVESLKADGCSVLLGVPVGWREMVGDSIRDAALHDVLRLADVISPWSVGRFGDPASARRHGAVTWGPDIEWCAREKLDFLPVVFPGFSWHNMHGGPLDQIPRRKGEFLWAQFGAAKRAGAEMIYVAMFDEVDEGTAIFKCTNDVPVGAPAAFIGYEGLPSDFYLRLTGQGGRLLRNEIPISDTLPLTNP